MAAAFRLDRRAFLRGLGGVALALPALDAMGEEVAGQIPRRFCAIYTANGMSLPRDEHGINDWRWFPEKNANGEFEFGKSTEPYKPFRKQLSFFAAGSWLSIPWLALPYPRHEGLRQKGEEHGRNR